jgi:hypothetical protein
MKNNVIDIIQRFQTRHALQEERELKDFHASGNGAVAPSIPDKNSIPEDSDKDINIDRSRPNETTRDMEFPIPHLERIVRTIRVGLPATAKAPILAKLGLSLIAAIGFGCFFVLSIL